MKRKLDCGKQAFLDAAVAIPSELNRMHHMLTMGGIPINNTGSDCCSMMRQQVQTHCLTIMRQAACIDNQDFPSEVGALRASLAAYLQWYKTIEVRQLVHTSYVSIIEDISSSVSDLQEVLRVLDIMPPVDGAKRLAF